MLKVAELRPAGTVTFGGTVTALAFDLVRPTTAPPEGAGLPRVTVPVEEPPPSTLVGERDTDEIGLGGAGRRSGTNRDASMKRPAAATRGLVMRPPLERNSSLPVLRNEFVGVS